MRIVFQILLTLVLTGNVCAQFVDDFSDGEFTFNPVWSGTAEKFMVDNNRLRLFAPAATDVAWLSTPSLAINDAVWEFWVRLNFNPSSSNFTRIYLSSSQHNLSGSLNGYFVMIGDTQDEVSLYRQTGTTRTKIIDGSDGRVNSDPVIVRVRVTRSNEGEWQLFTDAGATGAYILEGQVTDNTHLSSAFFGVYCAYTSTRSSHFYFDDFSVTGNPYVPPPAGTYKQIIFTELFPDPTPVIGLPEAEFVELYNRSATAVNLNGWRFADAASTATLPSFNLQPGNYVILAPTSAASAYQTFGDVIALPGFPTLNNSSDQLKLLDPYNNLIDEVNYSDTWYRNDDKKSGGWTLELIDTENICAEEENWAAAEHPRGGTPGQENSIKANKPDLTGPRLLSAFPITENTLLVSFDEKMENTLPPVNRFSLFPSISIISVAFGPSLREMILQLSGNLQPGVDYTLTVNDVFDCSGNRIQENFRMVNFGLPEPAVPGDVVIHELLFNPRPFGVDFVEVYNRSAKYINLKNWRIGNYSGTGFTNPQVITMGNLLLPPRGIMAFTTDPVTIRAHYPQAENGTIIKVPALPAFPDTEGSVSIITDNSEVSDYFFYHRDYHSVFLRDKEGVSIERIDSESETNNPNNWKSAASTVGFATPGLPNSNASVPGVLSGKVYVQPEVFLPLNGYPDFAEIRYTFEAGGKMAHVKILDQQGREIKVLASNAMLGTEGFFRWDGDRQDGTKVRPGYYLVWFEVFDNSGRVETFRKRIIVAPGR
ncbi:MAG: lamin tail domain-containing protein [Cyclobacteriaceae bacterium]|nr:lamin tail domain-containing protein [Cyclobacteriaceae bacterium]